MEKSRRVGEKKLLINKEESNISGVTACTINPIKYMTPAAGVGAPFNGFSSKGKLQSIFYCPEGKHATESGGHSI